MRTKLLRSFRAMVALVFMVLATNLFPLATAFAAATAINDVATVPHNTATIIDVLANDSPSNGKVITVTSPTNGTAVISANQKTVTYTPNTNFSGADSFSYTMEENGNNPASSSALVSVTVQPYVPVVVPITDVPASGNIPWEQQGREKANPTDCAVGQTTLFHFILAPAGTTITNPGTINVTFDDGVGSDAGELSSSGQDNGSVHYYVYGSNDSVATDAVVTGATWTRKSNQPENTMPQLTLSHTECAGTAFPGVTPTEPTRLDPCGTANDTYFIPTQNNVVYSVNGQEVTGGTKNANGATSVTVTAVVTGDNVIENYPIGGWVLEFTNADCEVEVPGTPGLTDPCGPNNAAWVKPADTDTVKWEFKRNGALVAKTAEGYVFVGGETEINFGKPKDSNEKCKITICHATSSIKNPYRMIEVSVRAADGQTGNNGNRADHFDEHDGPLFNVMMQQGDDWGDIIPPIEGVHEGLNWTTAGRAIYDAECVAGTAQKVRAEKPVKQKVTCEENGSYTIPDVEGVTYYVDGQAVAPGTYEVDEATVIEITAEANEGYVLKGKSSWTLKFKAPKNCEQETVDVCPNIIGDQAEVPAGYEKDQAGNCVQGGRGGENLPPAIPTVTPAATPAAPVQLADTGMNAWLTALIASTLLTLAVVLRYSPRKQIA